MTWKVSGGGVPLGPLHLPAALTAQGKVRRQLHDSLFGWGPSSKNWQVKVSTKRDAVRSFAVVLTSIIEPTCGCSGSFARTGRPVRCP